MTLVEATSLDAVSTVIVREHDLVVSSAKATIDHAIAAGEALHEARKLVPRGDWERYMAAVVGRVDVGRVYMRLARYQREIQETGIVSVDQAIRYLSERRAVTALAPALKDEARRLADQGLSTRQIATRLDVSPASAWRLLNPAKERHSRRRNALKIARARRALERHERDRMVRQLGGPIEEGYSLIRRALEALEAARSGTEKIQVRVHIEVAMEALYRAEDEVGNAVRSA